jgi:hypothetical protein
MRPASLSTGLALEVDRRGKGVEAARGGRRAQVLRVRHRRPRVQCLRNDARVVRLGIESWMRSIHR